MKAIQMRCDEHVADVLRELAQREQRSMSNMLERLVMQEGERLGLVRYETRPVTVTRAGAVDHAATALHALEGLTSEQLADLSDRQRHRLLDLCAHWHGQIMPVAPDPAVTVGSGDEPDTVTDDDIEASGENPPAEPLVLASEPPPTAPSAANQREQALRDAAEACGGNAARMADWLNSRGIPPARSGRWTRDAVNGWLRRKAN